MAFAGLFRVLVIRDRRRFTRSVVQSCTVRQRVQVPSGPRPRGQPPCASRGIKARRRSQRRLARSGASAGRTARSSSPRPPPTAARSPLRLPASGSRMAACRLKRAGVTRVIVMEVSLERHLLASPRSWGSRGRNAGAGPGGGSRRPRRGRTPRLTSTRTVGELRISGTSLPAVGRPFGKKQDDVVCVRGTVETLPKRCSRSRSRRSRGCWRERPGRLRRGRYIRILPGASKVDLDLSVYDPTRGRIVWRYKT